MTFSLEGVMSTLELRTLQGTDRALPAGAVERFKAGLRGELLTRSSPGYDQARTIWNAMIDRRPALIVRCLNAGDITQAVRFAREHEALVAIRGGGHNIAGNAVCDGGLMIDLSLMKRVQIDAAHRTAIVEPGCTLADFDREAQSFGLATPVGINSTTGIAGLTLGGGFGWLSRRLGLTVDNLLSADVVLADGTTVHASASGDHADLFWGLRGGGGNFGVVTSFEFRLHQVGPQVLSGLIVHPFRDAAAVLRRYREFVATTPDDVMVWAVLRKAPPLPFLPAEVHGKEVVILAACCSGDMAAGERALAPLRSFGNPIADVIGPHPFTGWQQGFDPLLTPGARNYWKSHNLRTLDDGFLDAVEHYATRLPSPHTELFVGQLGGAVGRVSADATAYAHRDSDFILNVHARWETPAEDRACIDWSRTLIADTARFASGGVYVNFMTDDEAARVGAAYGPNYSRLILLKQKYDPSNLFRMNQNLSPAVQV
jgi:FAD/FMN-containing dehydrogenase